MSNKLEILCTECGSVYWVDMEVIAVNNRWKIWCPYCKDDTGLTKQDLENCRSMYKDMYGWT